MTSGMILYLDASALTLSTFDRRLWAAAERVGLALHPANLPALLDAWKAVK